MKCIILGGRELMISTIEQLNLSCLNVLQGASPDCKSV